jgi:hypothetical protein
MPAGRVTQLEFLLARRLNGRSPANRPATILVTSTTTILINHIQAKRPIMVDFSARKEP